MRERERERERERKKRRRERRYQWSKITGYVVNSKVSFT